MLSKREKWLIEQAYDAGRVDAELWCLIDKPPDAAPSCRAWLAEAEVTSGTVERYLDEEAPR